MPSLTPLAHPFGAVLRDIDLESLTPETTTLLTDALHTHLVLVVKDQSHLSPRAQYTLTQLFDPAARNYGHGTTIDAKRSVLHPDLKTVPHQPQVQVIGHGFVPSYEGLERITLKHPHHRTFHRSAVPDADDARFTRFYRWHIDAALYGLHPPVVTSLLAVKVPRGRRQVVRYDDGTGEEMEVALGATAFVSGEAMYERLSASEKAFVCASRVEYAPHPYIWMSGARALPTGLGLFSEDREIPLADLPPIEEDKIKILPMVWKNPVTGKPALQVHPAAVRKIHCADGRVIDDLREVREIVYKLQRPGISPEHVYAHDWEEGDLVLFYNRGVLHSVVGSFRDDEVRLFRQCNLAASEGVVPYVAAA
ncbi:TauD/TfdA family dioxygenase [Aspergillus clavatus NRRL 1]|uniref:Taurine catabolism dioxygenase TauD, TfdA family protein n=1 Tax=Aspergillus clavatus (strain ATCC 1007 / CBS 513.65 / DSM 816 / NCTC 3887 / NRRL 1 / QM 1276 / 107) TaxID=344612 RepID=A1CGC4_ASPCL|nr:taurine catabolism dioxygenase TauD, TfdA family protein [Aspergillus clavatus NRRL 1]EAW11004.1 taurine catabolism dioxygenase TauD, TfdA family protein [Aspergillus clavatus NRRL 1]